MAIDGAGSSTAVTSTAATGKADAKDAVKVTDPEAVAEKDKAKVKAAQAKVTATQGYRECDVASHKVEHGQELEAVGATGIAGGTASVGFGTSQIIEGNTVALCQPAAGAALIATGTTYCGWGTAAIAAGSASVALGCDQKATGYMGIDKASLLKHAATQLNNDGEHSQQRAEQLQAEADTKSDTGSDKKDAAKTDTEKGAAAGGANDAASTDSTDDGTDPSKKTADLKDGNPSAKVKDGGAENLDDESSGDDLKNQGGTIATGDVATQANAKTSTKTV